MGYSNKVIDREVHGDVAETCPKDDAELKKAADAVIDLLYEAYEIERQDYRVSVPRYAALHPELQPAQQPLTDEHKAILKECRNQTMEWVLKARIPESGAFGGIAQDLDYLCEQLGVEND